MYKSNILTYRSIFVYFYHISEDSLRCSTTQPLTSKTTARDIAAHLGRALPRTAESFGTGTDPKGWGKKGNVGMLKSSPSLKLTENAPENSFRNPTGKKVKSSDHPFFQV